jgi:hypothetical protein
VAELVRQVTDGHGAAELLAATLAVLEVAEDGLARDEELVHEHEPWADRQPAFFHESPDAWLGLGPHLQVVVERRQLAVEREPVPLVLLHQVEQPVDQPDELQAEALEGEVPLPVPVGVRNEVDGRQAA